MHSLRGLSLFGTTGRIIRQEGYLLSGTMGRTIPRPHVHEHARRQEGYLLNDTRGRIIR